MSSTNTSDDLKVTINAGTLQQLKDIASSVGVDANDPVEVINKALKLIEFARKGNISISTPTGTYDVDLKKL